MRKRFFLLLFGVALPAGTLGALAAGCSGSIETSPGDRDGGGGGGQGGDHPITVGTGGDSGAHDALPDYTDPGCPDAGPPITMFECDPYNQNAGFCLPGEGCYIFVQYPSEPCEQEIYGAVCLPAGFGSQGDTCNGPQDCAGGFVCVVSGSGNQCVQLCQLTGEDGCPPGLVCEPIDVEGFGGCL
jgi:hypothetical protein